MTSFVQMESDNNDIFRGIAGHALTQIWKSDNCLRQIYIKFLLRLDKLL